MSAFTRFTAIFGVVAVLLTSRAADSTPIDFRRARTGIVHVGELTDANQPRWLGTGFLIDRKCTFVTATHVLKSAHTDRLVVRLPAVVEGRVVTHPVSILYDVADTDLSFIRVQSVNGKPCGSGGDKQHVFVLAKQIPDASAVGSGVLIVGHPVLASDSLDVPVLRKGHIASVDIRLGADRKALLLDLIGVPGFSGSPVILEQGGEVIGVVYGPGPTQRAFGFEWATPITFFHYELAEAAHVPKN